MAEFSRLVLTTNGQALIAKMIAGTSGAKFTKISTSSTQYTLAQLGGLSSLSGIQQTAPVSHVEVVNKAAVQVETSFTNTKLTTGYYMRTLGLYATDPDRGEILYAAAVEATGNSYMPPHNGVTVSGAYIKLVTMVGNAENVSLAVDPAAVATIADLKRVQDSLTLVKAASDQHIASVISGEAGVHGLRLHGTTLQYKNAAGSWISINEQAGGDLAGTYPNPTIKASVALTGVPTAPTPVKTDNTTKIATTAFVQAVVGDINSILDNINGEVI